MGAEAERDVVPGAALDVEVVRVGEGLGVAVAGVAERDDTLAEEPTAWQALVRLMSRSRSLRLTLQLAMLSPEAGATIRGDPLTMRLRDDLMATLDEIVRRAQQEGSLRPDVGAGDVAIMLSLLLRRIPNESGVDGAIMLDRVLALILDGLRAGHATTLPGRPITSRDISAHHPAASS